MSDTSRDPALLHPLLVERWEHMKAEWRKRFPKRPQPFLTATYRGPKDQAEAVENGTSRARFGESLHNFMPALAFDIAFLHEETGVAAWNMNLFTDMADIAKPLGLEWGGDWEALVDGPHFQLPVTAEQARRGQLPSLDPLGPKRSDEKHKLIFMIEGKVVEVHDLEQGMDVVVRYAPERRRIYVDARKESG